MAHNGACDAPPPPARGMQTACVHAANTGRIHGSAVPPIFQSATFAFGGGDLAYDDVLYTRCNNNPSQVRRRQCPRLQHPPCTHARARAAATARQECRRAWCRARRPRSLSQRVVTARCNITLTLPHPRLCWASSSRRWRAPPLRCRWRAAWRRSAAPCCTCWGRGTTCSSSPVHTAARYGCLLFVLDLSCSRSCLKYLAAARLELEQQLGGGGAAPASCLPSRPCTRQLKNTHTAH